MQAALEAESFSLPRIVFPASECDFLAVWVDGSVFHRDDVRLTRAGTGVFFWEGCGENFLFPICGPVQPVEHADFAAAAAVIIAADRPFWLKTDCQHVFDGLQQRLQGVEPCLPELDIWRQVFQKTQSFPKSFLRVSKVPGHPSRDVKICKVSAEDACGIKGAHKLAVAAATARLSPVLQAHDGVALKVHKAMVAIVNARNAASQKLMLYQKRKPSRPSLDVAEEAVAPPVTPAHSRKKRKDAAATLAGTSSQPSHDGEGLPLTSTGKYLNVVRNTSGTFSAKVTSRGKTCHLGVYPEAVQAARAVAQFRKTGVAPKLDRASSARVATLRVFAKKVDKHNVSATNLGRHVFDLSAGLLKCRDCGAEYASTVFSSASKLACPIHASNAGLKVDKRGSSTRAAKLPETRTNVLVNDLRAHNAIAGRRGWHVIELTSLDSPKCVTCGNSVTRNYVRKWMRKACPG